MQCSCSNHNRHTRSSDKRLSQFRHLPSSAHVQVSHDTQAHKGWIYDGHTLQKVSRMARSISPPSVRAQPLRLVATCATAEIYRFG
jgi:hypothetical protein